MLKGLCRNSFQTFLTLLTFYLHTYVFIKKVLTPITLFFHLLKNKNKTLTTKVTYTGAVLINLYKAFDTINYELLIAK